LLPPAGPDHKAPCLRGHIMGLQQPTVIVDFSQPSEELVTCTLCFVPQPRSAFRPDLKKKNGLRSNCKECGRGYARKWQKVTRQHARWKSENPAKWNAVQFRHMLKRYGITVDDYYAILDRQEGRCAICRTDTPKMRKGCRQAFVIDHDHATGQVRGLLCMNCNSGIGNLSDSIERVASALEYLRHWSSYEAARAGRKADEAQGKGE
jgi:hypothetical protein